MIDQAITKAAALSEALSYIQRFHNKVVVVKVGGSIMDDEQALSNLLNDIVFMNYVGMQPVLVHGGGKAINQAMETAGLSRRWCRAARYTDERTLAIAEHVLCNQINNSSSTSSRRRAARRWACTRFAASCLFAEKTYLQAATAGGSIWEWSAK
jgi:acetylglutamate kinase